MQVPRTYECGANTHCSVSCQIDGDEHCLFVEAPQNLCRQPAVDHTLAQQLNYALRQPRESISRGLSRFIPLALSFH